MNNVKYAVKLNGIIVLNGQDTKALAEAYISKMPSESQVMAEVVSVNNDNKEILLG